MFAIHHPSAALARGIEKLVQTKENSSNILVKAGSDLLARLVSVTVFPIFLGIELICKRIPKLLISIPICKANQGDAQKKYHKSLEKVQKFCLGILFSPLGLRSATGVSDFFLKKTFQKDTIYPFGVEEQFGKKVTNISHPGNGRRCSKACSASCKREKTCLNYWNRHEPGPPNYTH